MKSQEERKTKKVWHDKESVACLLGTVEGGSTQMCVRRRGARTGEGERKGRIERRAAREGEGKREGGRADTHKTTPHTEREGVREGGRQTRRGRDGGKDGGR